MGVGGGDGGKASRGRVGGTSAGTRSVIDSEESLRLFWKPPTYGFGVAMKWGKKGTYFELADVDLNFSSPTL